MDGSASDAVRLALLRHRVLLIALLSVLAVYAAAGFWLVPRLIRSGIEQYVSRDLGRHISIGEVRFNPFSLAVEIKALSLTEANGTPLVRFRLLRVEAAALRSLAYRAYTLSEVRLEQPDIRVRIGADGTLNLSQLKPPEAPGPPAKPGPLPAVRIRSLAVVDGTVGFEDLSRGQPFTATLRPIEFTLHDFRTAPKFENAYQFAGETLAGEKLSWSGEFSVQPLGSSGKFSVTGLKAATVAAYLQDALPFDLPSGSLDLGGEYRITFTGGVGLTLELPKLALRNIGIAPRGGDDTPWINVPQLDVLGTQVALADRRVSVERVNIDGVRVQLWREADGSINLQRLFASRSATNAPAAATAAAPPAAASGSWTVGVGTIALTNTQIAAEDRSTKPAVELPIGALSLSITGFSTQAGAQIAFTASTTLGTNGQLNTTGQLQLEPLNADTQLELKALDLVAFQPYVQQYTLLQIGSGQLAVKGRLRYAAKPQRGTPAAQFQGEVALANLATTDLAMQQDLVKWQLLQVTGIDYQHTPDRLNIASIAAHTPYARVIIGANGRVNVKTVLSTPTPSAPPPAPPPAPVKAIAAEAPMPIRIGVVSIEQGTANFTDQTVVPEFSSSMTGLAGTVTGLSSDPATHAEVKIGGSVDTYAPVEISGQMNPLAPALYCDLTMSFHNIELTTFNPYSGKFAGYNITKGKLSTDMHYKIDQRRLDASHHVVIDQLEFGAATDSKQAVSLPIKLAVALLKDRNGVIDIPLPISGSLDDPDFHIAPVVWQVLRHLLEKVALAPFSALASIFGGGHSGEELSYVDFAAGSAALADTQAQKITALTKALVERPQLKLDIPLLTETSTDDAAIARANLDQTLAKLPAAPGSADAVATQRLQAATLTGLYTQQLGAAPVFPPELAGPPGKNPPPELLAGRIAFLETALLPHYAPNAQQRADLGQARANAVQAAVLANTEIAPERVFLSNRTPTATSPQGSVRMELQVQ
ncbi:MAG TPA: DUF748 domain-containing protein [Steroidobacteraceae bacterium]